MEAREAGSPKVPIRKTTPTNATSANISQSIILVPGDTTKYIKANTVDKETTTAPRAMRFNALRWGGGAFGTVENDSCALSPARWACGGSL